MVIETSKPIFLVGCPRSGTTLVASRLNLHSKLAVTPESHFFEIIDRSFFKILDYPLNEKKLRKFFSRKRMIDFEINFDHFYSIFIQSEKTRYDVFNIFMYLFKEREKKNFWCEKTPQNLKYLNEILNYYPKAKIICIVRDGRDVALSLRKTPWRERNIFTSALEWNDYANIIINAQMKLDKKTFHLLKFEDLILKTENSLNKICEFLELEFENTLLSTPQDKPLLIPAWEIEWKGNVMKRFDSNAVGRWKSLKSSFERNGINYILEKNLKTFKYDTDSLSINYFAKFRLNIAIKISSILKLFFDFIEHYTKFRSKKYHPF